MPANPAPSADAIRLTGDDNVATVLRDVLPGETVVVRAGATTLSVTARDAVPLCHKICLVPIGANEAVVKYGQCIGSASVDLVPGRHVHVETMRSNRARLSSGSRA